MKKFKIKIIKVYGLGFEGDISYIFKKFKSRREAEKWCERMTNSSNNLWWGDGLYYRVEEEIKENEVSKM